MKASSRRLGFSAGVLVSVCLATAAAFAQSYLTELPEGIVPSQDVACAVAKVYLSEVYGKAQIERNCH